MRACAQLIRALRHAEAPGILGSGLSRGQFAVLVGLAAALAATLAYYVALVEDLVPHPVSHTQH